MPTLCFHSSPVGRCLVWIKFSPSTRLSFSARDSQVISWVIFPFPSLTVSHWTRYLRGSWLTSSSLQLNRVNGTSSPQSPLSTSGRVAAVGPYIQVPSAGGFPLPGDPVKPQSLTIASSAAHGRSKSGRSPQSSPLGSTWREWCGGGTSPYLCI